MSKALGFTDWLVGRSSDLLGRRVSRRGFIAKTTIVGTAVAATGCAVVTQQGPPPFARITDCGPGSLCRDGYTEFCCVINNGVNACPEGSIASGWWRADYSIFCDGTRYYIDCNDFGAPPPCHCGNGCDTRKVYCNHFRYGQCNTWIGGTGVIACRMVTCVPPFALDLGCGSSAAVDNATAGHYTDCSPYTPPPPPPPPPPPAAEVSLGSAVALAAGEPSVLVRDGSGAISQISRVAGVWGSWQSVSGSSGAASRVVGAVLPSGDVWSFVRGPGNGFYAQTFSGGAWAPRVWLGGYFTSDPAVAVVGSDIWVFGRGGDDAYYAQRWLGSSSTWESRFSLGPFFTSDPAAVTVGSDVWLFGRGGDNAYYAQRFTGGAAGPRDSLGGYFTSDPAAVAVGSDVWVFGRGGDNAFYAQRRVGASGTWEPRFSLGGYFTSDPAAVAVGPDVWLFGRGGDNAYYAQHFSGGSNSWDPRFSLGPYFTSDPAAVTVGPDVWLFGRGGDNALYAQQWTGGVWQTRVPLGGTIASVRGADAYS